MVKNENMSENITVRLKPSVIKQIDEARENFGGEIEINRPTYIRYVLKQHFGSKGKK